jgi:GPH family glycoside/pentoside/hexuronide:cation symporter
MKSDNASTVPPNKSVGTPVAVRSNQQDAFIKKFGESFPNCVISDERFCLEANRENNGGEKTVNTGVNNLTPHKAPDKDKPNPSRFIVPCGKKVIIALPFLAKNAFRYMRTSHLALFQADTVLVPLWWIAFVVVVGVSVDALTDPLVATFADQLRTRWGRRRPLLVIGSILVSIAFALLWMPCVFGLCPEEDEYNNMICVDGRFGGVRGSWIYLFIVYIIYYVCLDLVIVSLEALAAEMTPSYSDRTCLFGVNMVFAVFGTLFGVVLPPLVGTGTPKTQFIYFGVIFGVIMMSGCFAVAGCLKERGVHVKIQEASQQDAKLECAEQVTDGRGGIELVEKASTNNDAAHDKEMLEDSHVDIEKSISVIDFDLKDLEEVQLDVLEDNNGMVPGYISSFRNSTFRVLLICEILQALGEQLQYAVLPFVVKYVIMPQSLSYSNMYSVLAGLVIVVEIVFVPFWIHIASRYGKYNAFIASELALAISACLKMVIGPEEDVGLAPTIVMAILWGAALGGPTGLLDAMVADSIDYDEFLSGQRREGQYSMFKDFLPKLAEVPSTAVPLLVMGNLGYLPNVLPQNDDVYWTILVCFSVAPGFFQLIGALVMLAYPKSARDGVATLSSVQEGIVKHALGEDAYDPITDRIMAAPTRIRESIGGQANETSMQHFFESELKAVVSTRDKKKLLVGTSLRTVLWLSLAAVFIGVSVHDWHNNIDPMLNDGVSKCSNITGVYRNCAGFNDGSCTQCDEGFYGEDCSPCPGVVEQNIREDSEVHYVGSACNGFGTCNQTNGTCTCEESTGYSGPWCGVNVDNEAFTLLPIYIAALGVCIFLCVFHSLRLARACLVVKDDSITVDAITEYAAIAFGRELTAEERHVLVQQQTKK